MIYYTCVIIDKVEKTGLVYSSIPTRSGAGISGPDEGEKVMDKVVNQVDEKVKEAAQTAEEMQRDEGELADQSNKEEIDKEESECIHRE